MRRRKQKHNQEQDRSRDYLPYYVIKAAVVDRDPEALGAVLRHHQDLIKSMTSKTLYDEHGRKYKCTNQTLRLELEESLLDGIKNFRIRAM